jgi:hypothetical protein
MHGQTRYARNGDVHLAYQVRGREGPTSYSSRTGYARLARAATIPRLPPVAQEAVLAFLTGHFGDGSLIRMMAPSIAHNPGGAVRAALRGGRERTRGRNRDTGSDEVISCIFATRMRSGQITQSSFRAFCSPRESRRSRPSVHGRRSTIRLQNHDWQRSRKESCSKYRRGGAYSRGWG